MQIRYRYIYIDVPQAPRPAAPETAVGASILSALSLIDKLKKMDPAQKEKLEEIEQLLKAVKAKVNSLPSGKIQQAVMDAVSAIMEQLGAGDIEGALNAAVLLNSDVNKLVDATEQMERQIAQASVIANALQGPAKGLMLAIVKNAREAAKGADGMDAIQQITSMVARAVNIGEELRTLSPKSPQYKQALLQLAAIADDLGKMPKGEKMEREAVGMKADELLLTGFGGVPPSEAFKQLKSKTTDAFKQQKLSAMEDLATKITERFPELPGDGLKRAAAEEMRRIMGLAGQGGQGDLDEANAAMAKLFSDVDRSVKLGKMLGVKRDRAMDQLSRMPEGPARQMLEKLMNDLDTARNVATTPEELEKLDNSYMEAYRLASRLTGQPNANLMQSPELRQLKVLCRQHAPDSPTFGDAYKPDQARKPGGKPSRPGTQPLTGGARGTGTLRPESGPLKDLLKNAAAAVPQAPAAPAAPADKLDLDEFNRRDITRGGWLSGTEVGDAAKYDANNDQEVTKEEFLTGRAAERAKPPVAPPASPGAPQGQNASK